MTGRQLRVLFWKDIRLNRTILIFGVGLLVFAYVLAVGLEWYYPHERVRHWLQIFETATPMVIGFSALIVALLGAHVAGAEYADRSASFLAYQPPTRQCVLASKLLAALAPTLVLTGIAFGALVGTLLIPFYLVDPAIWPQPRSLAGHWGQLLLTRRQDMTLLLAFFWLLFTVSWSVGWIIRSGPIGIAASIAVPVALYMITYVLTYEQSRQGGMSVQDVFSIAAAGLGTLTLAVAIIVGLVRKT